MSSSSTFEKNTVSKLNDLVHINIDSVKGFEQAAEDVDDPSYAQLFRQLADDRRDNAEQIRAGLIAQGHEAADDGSAKGAVHRWWLDLRAKLANDADYNVLAEAERGEDEIKQRYEDVLKETAGSPLNSVLQSQYALVKAGHDKVRDLRDAEHARKH